MIWEVAVNKWWKIVLTVVGAMVVLGGGVWLFRPYTYHGTVLQSPEPVSDFTLQSAEGPVSLHDFRGKYVVLYFGYTTCPDVCPATMSVLARAMEKLGRQAEKVQVIMVSVDPERDTPEKVSQYARRFNGAFLGLTGTPDEIARIAAVFGIFYEKEEVDSAAGYLVTHTASTMVLNEQGRLVLIWPFGVTADEVAADLQHLVR